MNETIIHVDDERTAKFKRWIAQCKGDVRYKIEYRGQRGEYCDACLLTFVDHEWFVIDTLTRWLFKFADVPADSLECQKGMH